MSLVFHDTYKRAKMPFEPLEDGKVKMYNCGPTVYDTAHIGNLRAYVFADLLRRWLEAKGYEVTQVQNITDVDDKTIRRSREEGLTLSELTERFRDAFFSDLETLNILPAHIRPAATDHVDEMVTMIEELLKRDHAYRAPDGSIYFRVSSYSEYGNLSGKRLEDLRVGERVTSDEYESKDDVRDFALWKAWDEEDGSVFWETSLGKGRPGWHIECSAMSMKYLGRDFDIHTGGVDNIFPHHENEIAQSRCATDGTFARYWLHCDYLIVEGKKMSKSLGNFFKLQDLIDKGYTPREIRYVIMGTHYRSRLNFTFDGLHAARSALGRLDEFQASWQQFKVGDASAEAATAIDRAEKQFDEAMDDDLNISAAIAAIFNMVREVNSLTSQGVTTVGDRERLTQLWAKWDLALGVLSMKESSDSDGDDGWIEELIEERKQARQAKNFARADEIRDELVAKGILLKDSPEGTTWKREAN
ncbi:cysteine--tRNA ligase [bacterium]|nr:cysteine--tRNA ligase [bacterium]